jgi:hypothetical protein
VQISPAGAFKIPKQGGMFSTAATYAGVHTHFSRHPHYFTALLGTGVYLRLIYAIMPAATGTKRVRVRLLINCYDGMDLAEVLTILFRVSRSSDLSVSNMYGILAI